MYTVTIPTYDELMVMFPESDKQRILGHGLTLWGYAEDEMRIPANRILEFPEIRADDTMHNHHYDIYIHTSFYNFLKALEPQTFGSHRYLGRPHDT